MSISPELISLGLVLLALVIGVLFRIFSGRGHKVHSSEIVDLKRIGAISNGLPVEEFGKKATLLQFSAQYCAICPGVSRALEKLAYRHGGLKHIEVDVTNRLELAAHFNVNQTPTVFLLDPKGRVVFRFSGAPKMDVLNRELERYGIK